jgi:hypothetical protein
MSLIAYWRLLIIFGSFSIAGTLITALAIYHGALRLRGSGVPIRLLLFSLGFLILVFSESMEQLNRLITNVPMTWHLPALTIAWPMILIALNLYAQESQRIKSREGRRGDDPVHKPDEVGLKFDSNDGGV